MNNWKVLTPTITSPVTGLTYISPSIETIDLIFKDIPSRLLFLDYETNGLNYLAEDFRAVGIALSSIDVSGGIYIDIQGSSTAEVTHLLNKLNRYTLVCYNLTFDAGVRERMHRDYGLHSTLTDSFNYHCDVMGLIFQLDQGYNLNMSLKTMMTALLGWKDTNEKELDQWLIDNEYVNKSGKPDKSQMWRVPAKIMGRYAVLDAQATRDIYYRVIMPALSDWPDVLPFHTTPTIAL